MNKNRAKTKKDPLDGKVGYLLIATIAVQFLFPLSIGDSPFVQLVYSIFYISLFVTGIYLVSNSKFQMYVLIVTTIAWIVAGSFFSFYPQLQWLSYVIYIILAYFLGYLAFALLKYIFRSKIVTLDVILASCTIYLLLGGIFATIFNMIEIATWFPDQTHHAFVDSLNAYEDEVFPWQVMVYYSYATLSTLGYGDVLPITPWARSVAAFEAVVGVLYTAVIVARLVGLYAAGEVEEEFRSESAGK